MLRDAFGCYALFEKHSEAFAAANNFTEFYKAAGLNHLDTYAGGWIEDAFNTFKAGKKTYRGLIFPTANKFSDLFTAAYFLPTDAKQKPIGAFYMGGTGSLAMHCGGTRGYSKTQPDTRCHYSAKFYGTYVFPIPEIRRQLKVKDGNGYSYSFEAIRRDDGILILVKPSNYIGSTWYALLDLSENIEMLFDEETRAFLASEKQAKIDAWGTE